VVVREDGLRVAQACVCRVAKRTERLVAAAKIPQRYVHCTLESYDTDFRSVTKSLKAALFSAKSFVKAYPLDTDGRGLLFVGKPGRGKTHLSVGLLKALIEQRGVNGLFVDYRDLLKRIQNSYNPAVSSTELSILQPVFDAEVLVIDDLGATKPTDWVFDTVAHILNSRYNDRLTTIITTNFSGKPERPAEELAKLNDAQRVMSEQTLGDRIGDRVLSRLREMCTFIELDGVDFRYEVKRASFGAGKATSAAVFETPKEETGVIDVRKKLEIEAEERLFREMYQTEEPPVVGGARLGSKAARRDVSGSN
jgi:DNA replication protein DnaC